MKRAVKWLLEHAGAGLLLDPGLGKTSITLAAICILMKAGLLDRVVIIAPLRPAYLVWPAEIAKWADFNHLRMCVLHGKDRTEENLNREDIDIFVINPDGLPWLLTKKRFRMLNADTLVLDESSKFKHTTTTRFRTLRPFLKRFRRRWILTGTPVSNGLMNLFGQIFIIDLGRALGEFITHYRNRFFDPTGFGGYTWKIRDEKAEKDIYKAIKPYVLRLAAEDYIELPELVVNDITVVLPPSARRVYDEMEEEMFSILDSGEKIKAVNAAVASGKCRQIANGAIYRADRNGILLESDKFIEIHNEKLDAVEEYLDERNQKPTIITYEFKHDLIRLKKRLGKDTPVLGGGTSMKESARIEKAWNRGEIPWLLAQPSAMGHGLNMQESGDSLLWFSPIWDLDIYEQTIRRLRRSGSVNKRIFVTHIIAHDTVDVAIRASNRKKDKVQRSLLDALNTYRRGKEK